MLHKQINFRFTILFHLIGYSVNYVGWVSRKPMLPFFLELFMAFYTLIDVGILHADIKPDNIMFVSEGDMKIKLIDFDFLTQKGNQG